MPQIYLIKDVAAEAILSAFISLLSPELIEVVEKGFDLEGEEDVAVTAISANWTQNEKNVQIEIRYTAGEDEYKRGAPFDPSREEQKRVAGLVKLAFDEFLENHNLPHLSLSVWCKPHYDGIFESWE